MSKKKTTKQEFKPTKRHLSNIQKQKRRQKLIFFSGIGIISIAVIFVILGLIFQWYIPKVKPLNDVVIEVNGTRFKMSYYVDSLSYQTQGQSPQLVPYFTDYVANVIIENELLKQYAERLGFTVTDQEVQEILDENNVKGNQAIKDYIRSSLLQQKLMKEYFQAALPAETEHREVNAMFLESQTQVEEIMHKLAAGSSFEDMAAEYSLDQQTLKEKGLLGTRPAGVIKEVVGSEVLEQAVFEAQIGTGQISEEEKSKSVGYWLIDIIEWGEGEEPEARVRGMLLSSLEEANHVRALLDSGEDFEELAEEYSSIWSEEDKSEIGWVTAGEVSTAFDAYVFAEGAETGVVSDPIKDTEQTTVGGWWLYQVASIENKSIEQDDMDILSYRDLRNWREDISESEENTIDNYLDDDKKSFAVGKVI